MALTRRQREIYDFVCTFIAEQGYSPSLEEIGARFELASVATVHKHVAQLVAKGWLRKSWNRSRSLEPVGTDVGGGTRARAQARHELRVARARRLDDRRADPRRRFRDRRAAHGSARRRDRGR